MNGGRIMLAILTPYLYYIFGAGILALVYSFFARRRLESTLAFMLGLICVFVAAYLWFLNK
jgi:hypothetical protein